jgi:sec-independent protein translocase protein TatA
MFGFGLPALLLMLFPFGIPELLLILLIVVIIFGATRLPALGRGLGEGLSNFRQGLNKGKDKPNPDLDEKKDRRDSS